MPPAQQLLFPDPRPLVERLGRDFFRQLPEVPGVYLMRDESETVLYVGKAKNLRKRLGSYRVANPDRMPRRHLRLVRSAVRIDLQPCATEAEALARESELLRHLRPRFNRAGTWQAPPRWFGWRVQRDEVHLATLKEPGPEWRCFGPMGIRAEQLRAILTRLLWLALNPDSGFTSLPPGWFHGELEQNAALKCGEKLGTVAGVLEAVLSAGSAVLADDLAARFSGESRRFDQLCLANDLASLAELCPVSQSAPP